MNAITFINADMGEAQPAASLRVVGPRIAAIGGRPHPQDRVIDLCGDRLLPGLINAHDHLQLNGLPPADFGRRYRHVREWIEDVDAHRRADPAFAAGVAVCRDARLLTGGMKNLLAGVTTVAHHDPFYPPLAGADFPVRVLARYGWSHSLYLDGEEKVRTACRATPAGQPWIIHAAEGIDAAAAEEFERLDALDCLGPDTLLVHGVALTDAQRQRLADAGGGLVWCPSSNTALFGRTAQVDDLVARGRVTLGTDSRLSGAFDLLAELRIAHRSSGMTEAALLPLVTHRAACLLRMPERGRLETGAVADLLVLAAGTPLWAVDRESVRLVVIDGVARYGEKHYAEPVSPAIDWTRARVDGRAMVLDARIAALLSRAGAAETGLELVAAHWRAA